MTHSFPTRRSADLRQAELAKELPGLAWHYGNRGKYRNNSGSGSQHRKADRVRTYQGCAIGRLSRFNPFLDIFNLDDGIIDQNADNQREDRKSTRLTSSH